MEEMDIECFCLFGCSCSDSIAEHNVWDKYEYNDTDYKKYPIGVGSLDITKCNGVGIKDEPLDVDSLHGYEYSDIDCKTEANVYKYNDVDCIDEHLEISDCDGNKYKDKDCKDEPLEVDGLDDYKYNYIDCKDEPFAVDGFDDNKYNYIHCKDEPLKVDGSDDNKYNDIDCKDEPLKVDGLDDNKHNDIDCKNEPLKVDGLDDNKHNDIDCKNEPLGVDGLDENKYNDVDCIDEHLELGLDGYKCNMKGGLADLVYHSNVNTKHKLVVDNKDSNSTPKGPSDYSDDQSDQTLNLSKNITKGNCTYKYGLVAQYLFMKNAQKYNCNRQPKLLPAKVIQKESMFRKGKSQMGNFAVGGGQKKSDFLSKRKINSQQKVRIRHASDGKDIGSYKATPSRLLHTIDNQKIFQQMHTHATQKLGGSSHPVGYNITNSSPYVASNSKNIYNGNKKAMVKNKIKSCGKKIPNGNTKESNYRNEQIKLEENFQFNKIKEKSKYLDILDLQKNKYSCANYKMQKDCDYMNLFTEEGILDTKGNALEKHSLRKVSKDFNIPKSTIQDWKRNPNLKLGSGNTTVLTAADEDLLVKALNFTASCGFSHNRDNLKDMVQSYVLESGKQTPFKDGRPGPDWTLGFERRHKDELRRRQRKGMSKARAKGMTQDNVKQFYDIYEQVLRDHNLGDKPWVLFNIDAKGLTAEKNDQRVYVGAGVKNAYCLRPPSTKVMYTVLFCCSAIGHYLPPYTIYKSNSLWDAWCRGGVKDACYGFSESGWMFETNFESWFSQVFVPQTREISSTFTRVLLYDGHNSHITYKTVKAAMDNNIVIVCLPPSTRHALQPLDVAFLKSVKVKWANICQKWFNDTSHKSVDKATFPSLLKELWEQLEAHHAVNGFRKTGLYPLNRNAVDNKILGSASDPPSQPAVGPRSSERLMGRSLGRTSTLAAKLVDRKRKALREEIEVDNTDIYIPEGWQRKCFKYSNGPNVGRHIIFYTPPFSSDTTTDTEARFLRNKKIVRDYITTFSLSVDIQRLDFSLPSYAK